MTRKAKLLSLEQRRSLQILSLMYSHKNNADNLRVVNRLTRAAQRDQFYVEHYNNIKYKKSPFYKGAELCDFLPMDIVNSGTIFHQRANSRK